MTDKTTAASSRSDADELPRKYGQGCPIAVALDVLGDRWTLLLLRDLSHASLRFADLQAINPGISPNLLARRLRRLETGGMVVRRRLPPPGRVVVYELLPDARAEVLPILNALGRFGASLFERMPPSSTVEPFLAQLRLNAPWVLAKGADVVGDFVFELDGLRVGLHIDETRFEPSTKLPERPVATIRSNSSTMTRISNGGISVAEAEAGRLLSISGDRQAAVRLIDAFGLGPGALAGSTQ